MYLIVALLAALACGHDHRAGPKTITVPSFECTEWPEGAQIYGCSDDNGESWENLSLSTDLESCKRKCLTVEEQGCCGLWHDLGCWFNKADVVSTDPEDRGVAIDCDFVEAGRIDNSANTALPFRQTRATFTDDDDLLAACKAEFGSDSTIADWEEITALSQVDLELMLANMGIPVTQNDRYYFVTDEGLRKYGSYRQYFFERHDGAAPSNWLVHDQFGVAGSGVISLGSWYNIEGPVICVAQPDAIPEQLDTSLALSLPYKITEGTYGDDEDLSAACTSSFGSDAVIADWNDLSALSHDELAAWLLYNQVPVSDKASGRNFYVTFNGSRLYQGYRQYNFQRRDGPAPSNWLVHGQSGGDQGLIILGSWYEIEGQVVCKVTAAPPVNCRTYDASSCEAAGCRLKKGKCKKAKCKNMKTQERCENAGCHPLLRKGVYKKCKTN